MDLRDAWARYDEGEHVTTFEMVEMLTQGRQAEAFLAARGETGGVLYKLRQDLNALERYLESRRRPQRLAKVKHS